jgi:hypothetical protein
MRAFLCLMENQANSNSNSNSNSKDYSPRRHREHGEKAERQILCLSVPSPAGDDSKDGEGRATQEAKAEG